MFGTRYCLLLVICCSVDDSEDHTIGLTLSALNIHEIETIRKWVICSIDDWRVTVDSSATLSMLLN